MKKMRTRKVIFLLFLFTCIIFGMSFVSAENNSTLDDDNINYQNNVIGVNHDDSINDEDICADSNSNNQINKNKSFRIKKKAGCISPERCRR